MRIQLKVVSALVLFTLPVTLHATTLAFSPAQSTTVPARNYLGEKFLTGGTGSYNNLVFDFLTSSGAPYAIGTGYLLSQQYTGTPAALSSTTPGFLADIAASRGFYTFDPAVTLQSMTTYFFYENALAPKSAISGGAATVLGTEYLYATSTSGFAAQAGASAAFNLTGTASATPELSSLTLVATGIVSLAGLRRTRSRPSVLAC